MANRGITVNVKPSPIPKGMSHLSQQYFFDYFSVKFLQRKHADNLCSNRFWLRWDADKMKLDIPKKQLERCLRSGKRFVFQTVELTSRRGGSHANSIIGDMKPVYYLTLGTQEAKKATTPKASPQGLPKYAKFFRWDPQGTAAISAFKDFKYEALDRKLEQFFASYGYAYEPPQLFCPYLSAQFFEEGSRISGFCANFSVYFTDMVLTYPDMSIPELIYRINLKMRELRTQKNFEKYILTYAQQIYNLMWEEFPQYKDFFIRFDKYASRPTKEFKEFEKFLHHLLLTDQDQTMID